MKYEITPDDQRIIASDLQNDRTLKHLRNLSFYKFAVGDVLIREDKYNKYDGGGGFEWKTKLAECGIPNKYVYVFENELGIGYIRRLSVNGRKFVERPICVTEFDPDQTRFALDPEYADHMLLSSEDEEFDAKSRYDEIKKKREQIHRKNKKIIVPLPDEAAAIAWMSTLKVGDQIWYGFSIGNIHKDPYFVHEIHLQVPKQPSTPNFGWASSPYIKISSSSLQQAINGHLTSLYSNNLWRYYIFMQRPLFVDEVIN